MKVIKVGNNTQSRIAQACDRCRSKKIRCDGVRPCCTQCANVGFECKTSDKLSRRAFPRGYTESLEERVRALESEVRDLKNLLDEKDEKIDVLSRIHSFTSPSQQKTASSVSPPSQPARSTVPASNDDAVHVPEPVSSSDPNEVENSGVSNTRGFTGIYPLPLIYRHHSPPTTLNIRTNNVSRCFHFQTSRPRPVSTGNFHEGFDCVSSSYFHFSLRPGSENGPSSCIRSTYQHLLPRMGPALSSCPPTYHSQGV